MNHIDITMKRIVLYVIGLFFLALGVGFSIQAALGVSPVSSLAYAFALTTGLSVGIMTIVANILFIILQAILKKRIQYKEYGIQLLVTFLFGFYMDLSLYLVRLLPIPETLWARWIFLIISLFVVSIGLLGYFNAKLPLMPYDALTFVISERFQLQFTKAKITSDLVNVCVAGLICLIFIHAFGSIGIGTLVAAYFIGKILGFFMSRFQEPLKNWVNKSKQEESTNLL
ncbi:YitT family protein [Lysinibacillus sp. BW-2-10]|uniref:YczE/YyaS/YitT family protein n=1 Tax=Lysinibacillus sp. BW-2-10 TaxID=2590030 RepID=UPI00117D20FA|nr:DUF6198 family protein [Lysinibacillus sp. BW-2-10]TSI08679.1 hypothetical protein FJQ64_06950 [Lysinibacillus sp. BW-2-10]